jgi:hypothetical protein
MSASLRDGRPVRIAIRNIAITAASPLEARRHADALPAALERAFARLRSGAPEPRRPRAADRIAAEVARAVAQRIEGAR